ncbi:MAG: endonuclease/exonuclease/phosphatase family protein [Bacteroidaceae bacterium]|nr:endonuclease/exonuclease/phosphatase family protein [Bacteroidaceae bacterium]
MCSIRAQQTFTVLSYNIENAFDTIHDEGKNDWEYCADGERKWNMGRLFKKLKSVSKVIAAADERRPVDLIGLCEVENDTVMHYLTERTPLKQLGYRYVMTHSKDDRGIDVALLYSPFTFHPIEKQPIRPKFGKQTTRDILHVAGTITGGDTVDVYVLHLPSKRGGGEAQKLSMSICQQLQAHTDSIRAVRQHPNLIIMGDFNAETNSPQLKLLTRSHRLIDRTARLQPGTYKYQGEWSTLDHILTHTTTLSHQQTHILTLPFLTEPDPTHGDVKPYRTYLGPSYHGGISDHLPIVSIFQIKKESK